VVLGLNKNKANNLKTFYTKMDCRFFFFFFF